MSTVSDFTDTLPPNLRNGGSGGEEYEIVCLSCLKRWPEGAVSFAMAHREKTGHPFTLTPAATLPQRRK